MMFPYWNPRNFLSFTQLIRLLCRFFIIIDIHLLDMVMVLINYHILWEIFSLLTDATGSGRARAVVLRGYWRHDHVFSEFQMLFEFTVWGDARYCGFGIEEEK
jgi:hypothetical protein